MFKHPLILHKIIKFIGVDNMSIKQLIEKINKLHPNFIEEVKKSEHNIFELMDNDIKELIVNNINLNLNDKEYRILTNNLYGYYSYIDNMQELKENIKIDYFEYKIIDYDRFKTIIQFKKYLLSES